MLGALVMAPVVKNMKRQKNEEHEMAKNERTPRKLIGNNLNQYVMPTCS